VPSLALQFILQPVADRNGSVSLLWWGGEGGARGFAAVCCLLQERLMLSALNMWLTAAVATQARSLGFLISCEYAATATVSREVV
jgi:hypothetical protein